MINCCQCGKEFEAKRSNQNHCLAPCRARYCPNCNYKYEPPEKEAKPGSSEQRLAQMDELFRGYESVEPIRIPKLPDGTRVTILSDMQIPFEDRWLVGGTVGKIGAVERFLQFYQPDFLIYNGDIMDCYTISSFSQSPNRKWTLKQEADMTKRMLKLHKEIAPSARLFFIDGNHEERIWRMLVKVAQSDPRARELLEVLNITSLTSKHLLDLPSMDIEWLPYGSYIDLLGFVITHGNEVSQFSSYTARKMSDRYRSSGCSGHTHRLGAYYYTGKMTTHCWLESGALCRLDAEYLQNANWQQGFVAGEVRNNKLHPNLITAFDGRIYAMGQWF